MKHKIALLLIPASLIWWALLDTSFALLLGSRIENITIVATVRPVRIIVVDRELNILQIISNTAEEIRPIVALDSPDGKELPYSDGIASNYEFLKPSINFSKPGVVYKRSENLPVSLYQRIRGSMNKWLQLPF